MTLAELCRFVAAVVPGELLDGAGQWLHLPALEGMPPYGAPKGRRERLRLTRLGQKLLCGFADSPRCRQRRDSWSNPEYCPPAPYGAYVWHFHARMVCQLLRPSEAFRQGVAFGREPKYPYRDANPYDFDTRRGRGWDLGYILGLHWDEVSLWLEQKRAASAS